MSFDWESLLKYLFEGLAVAVATYLIPSSRLSYMDVLIVGLTAAAVFAILDQFSPSVATGARQGSGFAIGYQQIGMGPNVDPVEESNLETPTDPLVTSETPGDQPLPKEVQAVVNDGPDAGEAAEIEAPVGFDGFHPKF
uniref:Uncharacterized protein n=1 Tax=viral metagenome TaxID=1070528 RepID=A0A6C0BLW4_9ZZZZ